jgi:hypothetical protein
MKAGVSLYAYWLRLYPFDAARYWLALSITEGGVT